MLTLVLSSSLGSSRGSVASGIVFDEESRDVAARDARVEPYKIHTFPQARQPLSMVFNRKKPLRITTGPGCP
jgi:hypothetical protein